MRAGEHELRPEHRREIRVAPRVRVEHRNDRQQCVAVRDPKPERRGRRNAECVQDRRAMRVDDPLAAPGRPAREAHRGRFPFVETGLLPLVRARRGQEILVGILDHEDVLDLRPVLKLLEQRKEAAVDDHRLVAAVVGDIGEFVRMQAQVQRMEDEPAARNAEVRLEVLVVVPGERRDSIAALEPELFEGDGELLGSSRHVPVGVTVEALVRQPGDDLLLPEEGLRPPQDRGKRELVVHHQAVHRRLPPRSGPMKSFPISRRLKRPAAAADRVRRRRAARRVRRSPPCRRRRARRAPRLSGC